MKSKPTDTPTAPAGAPMPRPWIEGRETESVRRDALANASPTLEQKRRDAEAALAEAEVAAAAARAALEESAHLAEVLRSHLIDERRAVSNVNFWRGRPDALAAEVSALEARLADSATRFAEGENAVFWARAVEHLPRLREELAQARRVLPLVEAALEAIRKQRADLQVKLGFEVRGVLPSGLLEGEQEESEPQRFEWRGDGSRDTQRLQPVAA